MSSRRGSIAIVLIGAGLLAASKMKRSEPKSEDKPDRILTGNVANDMLLALSSTEQATHLGNMVAEGCVGVRAFYMGMASGGIAEWSVGCSNGLSYSVGIENDEEGSATTIDCRVLEAISSTSCFIKFSDQANRPGKSQAEFKCGLARLPRELRTTTVLNLINNLSEYAEAKPYGDDATRRRDAEHLLDGWASDCNGIKAKTSPDHRRISQLKAAAVKAPATAQPVPVDPYGEPNDAPPPAAFPPTGSAKLVDPFNEAKPNETPYVPKPKRANDPYDLE